MAPRKRRASEIERPAKRQSTRRSSVAPRSVARAKSPAIVQHASHGKVKAKIFVHGNGDCGQLGLGEDVQEKTRPFPLDLNSKRALQVVAGGMHTVALAEDGSVWTWGVNDEGALGRQTAGEIWEKAPERKKGKDGIQDVPGRVAMPAGSCRVLQISAGDSHSMALTDSGCVYGWGAFRNSSGVFGFMPGTRIQLLPALVYQPPTPDLRIVKIASGTDHVVALMAAGKVLTWGSMEQGRLGRLPARTTGRGDMRALQLTPAPVVFKRQRGVHTTHMVDVAAGNYSSFALTADGRVEAWGLNNYGQLGVAVSATQIHAPSIASALADEKVSQIAGGQFHTLAVTEDGKLLSWGRTTYGGLGRAAVDANADEAQPAPTRVDGLDGVNVAAAAAGIGVSGALSSDGRLWMWGFGDQDQLGLNSQEDEAVPSLVPASRRLQGHKVVQLSVGGQHTALLAVEDPNAPPPPAAAAAVDTEASAADAVDGSAPNGISSGDGGTDGAGGSAAANGAAGSSGGADPGADLWAKAVAKSARAPWAQQQPAAAAPAPAAAPASNPADLWAQAAANFAQQNAASAAAASDSGAAPPRPAAPAAAPVHGAEAAIPEERDAAPASVADGPSLKPGALGFAGAAAPTVTDRPFGDSDNPAPTQ